MCPDHNELKALGVPVPGRALPGPATVLTPSGNSAFHNSYITTDLQTIIVLIGPSPLMCRDDKISCLFSRFSCWVH